eukprot:scaffold79561_cov18-Tisochrysis_lutea.AAC.1
MFGMLRAHKGACRTHEQLVDSEPKQSEMRSQVNAKSLPVQSPLVCKSTCEPDAASLKATVKTKL